MTIQTLWRKALCCVAFSLVAQSAWADGLEALNRFIKTTKNGRAQFVQTVTLPSNKLKVSRGTFEFLRPNRFKFSYSKPFEQTIVADGQTLWLYDVDLNQVTARKLSTVMAGSPAALFSAAADIQVLQNDYVLQAIAPAQASPDDLEWVSASPKSKEGAASLLQVIKVGFRQTPAGVEIAALEMTDSFGQISQIKFEKVQLNTQLTAENFNFKVPAGVSVLRP